MEGQTKDVVQVRAKFLSPRSAESKKKTVWVQRFYVVCESIDEEMHKKYETQCNRPVGCNNKLDIEARVCMYILRPNGWFKVCLREAVLDWSNNETRSETIHTGRGKEWKSSRLLQFHHVWQTSMARVLTWPEKCSTRTMTLERIVCGWVCELLLGRWSHPFCSASSSISHDLSGFKQHRLVRCIVRCLMPF